MAKKNKQKRKDKNQKKYGVTFYRLTIGKMDGETNGETDYSKEMSCSEIELIFDEIVDHMSVNPTDGCRAVVIGEESGGYVIQLLSRSGREAFLSVGHMNQSDMVALRNGKTMETEELSVKANQSVEVFTYCLLDFERCILSFISRRGAPQFHAIKALFNALGHLADGYVARLAAITSQEVWNRLLQKETVGRVEVEVAVPKDSILSEIGMPETDYEDVQHTKTLRISYTLGAERNQSLFSSSASTSSILSNLKKKFGPQLRRLRVRAKNSGDVPEVYDLLTNSFTRKVTMSIEEDDSWNPKVVKEALSKVYENNKAELAAMTRD